MYDAVYVYALGLQSLDSSHRVQLSNMSCRSESAWQEGLSLINYMNSVGGPINYGVRRGCGKIEMRMRNKMMAPG